MIEQPRTQEQQDTVNKLYAVMILTIDNANINQQIVVEQAVNDFLQSVRLIDLLYDPKLIWC